MIKLKKLLKESSPGFTKREFGDPLPTLKGVMKQHQNKVVREDEASFSQPIPAQIERYMKKFINAVQGARLNRRRVTAILGRVVGAMNIEPNDLMRYVRKVKKGL